MAEFKDVIDAIVDEYNSSAEKSISYSQRKSMINRSIELALEKIDSVAPWNFAIKSYSKTIQAGKNSVSIGLDMIFKPLSCIITIGDNIYPLDYINLTDFENRTALLSDNTTSYPNLYSIGGNKLYVGPGLLADSAVVTGKYQRKLTIDDIPYLPANLIIDRSLMRLCKKGTPTNIAAWSGWKEGKADIERTYKITAEKHSYFRLDEQVEENMEHMDSLDN